MSRGDVLLTWSCSSPAVSLASSTEPSCPSTYDEEEEDTAFWDMLGASQAWEAPTPTASSDGHNSDAAAAAEGDPAFFCAHPFWAEPLPFHQFFDQHEQLQGGDDVHHHHDQQQHQQHGGECHGEEREDEVRGLWCQLPLSVRSAHEIEI